MAGGRTRVYFDGGCRPNPGPIETAVLVRGVAYVRHDIAVGDNGLAEWLALIEAAGIARRMGIEDLLFVGDSSLVINQAKGLWTCRGAAYRACLERFRALMPGLAPGRLRLVPRAKNLAGIALERRYRGVG